MDQLNSHKLRHEAKTLICEICAYACKRKYELRTHMLAKHSGTEKAGAVYQCKYCTYTTCYRQALQNHENCKHTRLKEFRCALCAYSTFSSVSLFLHKRKVHGYVPGDKAWLENYALAEKQRNSAELLDFFSNSPSANREEEQPPSSEEPVKNQRGRSADRIADLSRVTDSPTVHTGTVLTVVSQEIAKDSVPSGSLTTGNHVEEHCTLVLTTLSTTDCQTAALENGSGVGKTLKTSSLNCNSCDISQEMALFSPSSTEEENNGKGEVELVQCDLDETLSEEDPPDDPAEGQTYTTVGMEDVGAAGASSAPERNQLLQSNASLEAVRKHDKEQAESMVLEGRVQMLVVPRKEKKKVDSCKERSYATNKEADFQRHRTMMCRTSGARSKQSRPKGLDGHGAKTIPGLPRKTRTVSGILSPCLDAEGNSTVGQEEEDHQRSSQDLRGGADPVSSELESNRPGSRLSVSRRKNCKDPVAEASSDSEHQARYAVREDGKFACKLCDFASVRAATVARHLSKCEKRRGNGVGASDRVNDETRPESAGTEQPAGSLVVSGDLALAAHGRNGCAEAEQVRFRSSTAPVLDVHSKKPRGADELELSSAKLVRCHLCDVATGSRRLLARHLASAHEEGSAPDKPLRCGSCQFACRHPLVLEQHLRSHGGRRLYRCAACAFCSHNRQKMTWHLRIHTGEKPYGCERCRYTCADPFRLKVGSRPYKTGRVVFIVNSNDKILTEFENLFLL